MNQVLFILFRLIRILNISRIFSAVTCTICARRFISSWHPGKCDFPLLGFCISHLNYGWSTHQLAGTMPAIDSPFARLAAPAIALSDHASLQHHDRFICLLPQLARPWLISIFTMVIINSTVDNRWQDISGEIHPIYFILHIIFFKRAITLVCKLSHAGFKPVYITVNYGESQANSSSSLKTRGLQWHDSGTPGHGRGW